MRKVRLDRLLSVNCIPRREGKLMVKAGRVCVDGVPVGDPSASFDMDSVSVTLDGKPLRTSEHLHLMIHKPAGVITATEDKRSQTVVDLIPASLRPAGLGPVGRLDKDVTGLVILTTDGQLAHRLISPRFKQGKVYIAQTENPVGQAQIDAFERGVELKDFTARSAGLRLIDPGDPLRCEVTLAEGKYHQVKRMLAAVGCPVVSLHRVSIAGVALDPSLAPGEYRDLTADEVGRLYRLVSMEEG